MKRHVASQAMEIPLESWWHFGRNPTNGICCQRSCMWFLPAMEISLGYLDFSFLVLTDIIENHHEPPQNESWFLVWILSKVPRYSILCYIMLYIIQYIYTHLWSSHKVSYFLQEFFCEAHLWQCSGAGLHEARAEAWNLPGALARGSATAFVAGMGGMGW